MTSVCIVVDIQNDYFPDGKFPLSNPDEAAEHARTVCDFCRAENIPVIFIRHINDDPAAAFFGAGTKGSEIHQIISPQPGETIIVKHTPNSFHATDLSAELAKCGARHLIVCGMMSHMCIDTTVRAAKDLGYSITLIHDACTTRDLVWSGVTIPAKTVHAAFMASLEKFAAVVSTEEFLA